MPSVFSLWVWDSGEGGAGVGRFFLLWLVKLVYSQRVFGRGVFMMSLR